MSTADDNVNIMITFPDGNKREFVKGINGLGKVQPSTPIFFILYCDKFSINFIRSFCIG